MRTVLTSVLTVLAVAVGSAAYAEPTLSIGLLGTYTTGLANIEEERLSAETVALRGNRMYVTNASDVSLDIVDVSDPTAPALLQRVDLTAYGGSANSVDVSAKNLIAVAVAASQKTDPGTVVFLTPGGQVIRTATVGAGPDMVVFTPNGDRLLVANEGEPDCYGVGCTDPEGSVSVIDLIPRKSTLPVHTIGFGGVPLPAGVRNFGPGASIAQDLEPEYIAVSEDGTTAWVTLQENNAIARLDLDTLSVTNIFALRYKDHGVSGQGLDPSDRDGDSIVQPWSRVFGMYQPDAIAQFRIDGRTYLVTANEGDARDYEGFAEESRARAFALLQPSLATIPGVDDNAELGRLTVTTSPPGNDLDNLYAFGGRSISIWDATTGTLVWDSGDQLEQITKVLLPDNFNSDNAENNFDNRSDNKGPEPEAIAVGTVDGRTYAFVGLERVGGVMVFDITVPQAPVFQTYIATRDFSTSVVGPDSGPEVLRFITPERSPTGAAMLLVANELTGTVTLFALTANP